MFGYITPEKQELKVKEYEIYRANYCGVCRSIGRRYGQIPRLTLNYDSAFLAILIQAVCEMKNDMKMDHCLVHPLNKRLIADGNEGLDYAADMSLMLFYYKLKDDWDDEKKISSLLGMGLMKKISSQMMKKYKEKCIIVENNLIELRTLEKERTASIDEAAEPFAKIMEEITAANLLYKDEKTDKILRWLGYNLGKWIYLIDAFDDLGKDILKGSYNPLIYQFGTKSEELLSADYIKEKLKDKVEFMLIYCLSEVGKAYELLNIKDNDGILSNIIYMGLLRKTEQILEKGSCKEIE